MKKAVLWWVGLFVFLTVMTACGDDGDGTETPDGDNPSEDGDDSEDGDGRPDGDEDGDSTDCPSGFEWNEIFGGCLPAGPDGDDSPDGDNAPDGDDNPDGDDAPDGDVVVDPACAALTDGTNTDFMVDGTARTFKLGLPDDVEDGGPWPVVFNWHGYGDTMDNMARFLSPYVNNQIMPFILVTPDDLGYMPTTGLDWAILAVDENNVDARLFDEVLVCLDQRWGVDDDHIHSLGFSAGAIMTDVLAVTRGDVLASTITWSGGYFSNPDNANAFTNWIAFGTENPFVQLIAHGGSTDNFNAVVLTIQFDQMGQSDVSYLNAAGHDVIQCDHGGGHTVPGGLQGTMNIQFLADHPKGIGTSPYVADGLPSDFPDYCAMRPKN